MTTGSWTTHVDAPPEVVFARLVDPTRVPTGIATEPVHDPVGGVGAVYGWRYRLLGMSVHGVVVATEVVPPRRLVCRHLGPVGGTATFLLEPEGDGTRLRRTVDFAVRVPLAGRLLERMMLAAAAPGAHRTAWCPRLVDLITQRDVDDVPR